MVYRLTKIFNMKEYNPFQITIQFYDKKELIVQHTSCQVKYIIECNNKFIIQFKPNWNYLNKSNFEGEYMDKVRDYTNIIIETSKGIIYKFKKKFNSIDGIIDLEINDSQMILVFSDNRFEETKGERKRYLKKKHNL